jgi:hypothetical protein
LREPERETQGGIVMWKEIEQLRRATVGELRVRYLELFGQPSRSNHKQFLFRRVAWRLQALAYGELSEQARQRALTLAQDVDLRIKAPAHLVAAAHQALEPTLGSRRKPGHDVRLPKPGSVLRREYKGQMVVVEVLPNGFQYQDRFFKSLSAVARQATGTPWNGYEFFRLKASAGSGE